ncbi:MAG: hypothetical protein JWP31_363 [Aeromicrobium sp.]|nr:hypothetical protein [Aeromicrobium sp.]
MTPYRERLTAPLSWWIAALAFAVVWGWVFLVISDWPVAVVTTVIVGAVDLFAVWRYGSFTVVVDAEGLRAGRAFVETAHIGDVTALDRTAYRRRLGVDADARAHLATRPYLDHGVAVSIADPADPAPYWLVATRHPAELAAALDPTAALDLTAAPAAPAPDPTGDLARGEEA